jgi:hypothetical protein
MKKIAMIEETLYEFAKRGRPKKIKRPSSGVRGIDSTDKWGDSEDEDMVDPDELDVDTTDMENADTIEIEEDVFDDKLFKALSNEVKMSEPARRNVRFRLKGDLSKALNGIPMAKLGSNAFLFKLRDGSMKKVFLRDMVLEQEKIKSNRAKTVNEEFEV